MRSTQELVRSDRIYCVVSGFIVALCGSPIFGSEKCNAGVKVKKMMQQIN